MELNPERGSHLHQTVSAKHLEIRAVVPKYNKCVVICTHHRWCGYCQCCVRSSLWQLRIGHPRFVRLSSFKENDLIDKVTSLRARRRWEFDNSGSKFFIFDHWKKLRPWVPSPQSYYWTGHKFDPHWIARIATLASALTIMEGLGRPKNVLRNLSEYCETYI